ncbi:MAG: helix-turn-helix domain-containing protein [Candidatus Freyarchaeota archaeon]
MLMEGVSIRGVGRVMGVSKDTVSRWRNRAAEHSEEVSENS